MNLEELDKAIDAIEPPKYLAINKWWFEFLRGNKRQSGRLIRQRKRKIRLKEMGQETDLCCILQWSKK